MTTHTHAHDLNPHELSVGLRASAAGDLRAEASVELLIRHQRWLEDPELRDQLIRVRDQFGEDLGLDWDAAATLCVAGHLQPEDRAVLAIAISLARAEPIALHLLIPSLQRESVALVTAAIAHAAGTHLQVEHIGELTGTGEWVATSTSPRVQLGPVVAWPERARLDGER